MNKKDKTISIHENFEKSSSQAIVVEKSVVSYDPAVEKSSTVVATVPAKRNDFDKDKGSDLDINKNKDMEKINIANKLRYRKKGTKLYSPLFGDVLFDFIFDDDDVIRVISINDNNERNRKTFDAYGSYFNNYSEAECLLFPSKDNRDWNDFQILEAGHRVMCSNDGKDWCLNNYFKTTMACCISDEIIIDSWKYIVPVEGFDFTAEDITINKEKSIA